jgi:hypothetical protein
LNRKIILLNLGLLALAGWLFWMLRLKWIELHQHEHTVLSLSPQVRKRLSVPVPMPLSKPMAASDYNEVAQKMLFSKDRNPNVIVEVKPVPLPPPPPPMPQLPAYYGEMALGEPVIVLRLPKGVQKNYHAGEQVGPFQLVSFDAKKVVFEWDGQTVERKPEELTDKEDTPAARQAAPPSAPAVRTSVADPPKEVKGSDKLGRDAGTGFKLCVAGDDAPAGTVVDGYKKKIVNGMMGPQCLWEQVNP